VAVNGEYFVLRGIKDRTGFYYFFGFLKPGIRRPNRRSVICASLFGVGAPEALVIGVVALLVFGPKGLAEVNLRPQGSLSLYTVLEVRGTSNPARNIDP
jgi:hypothetical protein